jgi:hypothetical protein
VVPNAGGIGPDYVLFWGLNTEGHHRCAAVATLRLTKQRLSAVALLRTQFITPLHERIIPARLLHGSIQVS